MALTRKPSPEPRTDDTDAELPGRAVGGTCNLPGCPYDAEVRGLCDAHWATHRGLGDPLPATVPEGDPGD